MEKRLIDADAIFDKVEANYRMSEGVQHTCEREFLNLIADAPTVDAVPVDFINQKIVELQSCANQHFNDGHEVLATCVWETIRLLGSFLKEWRGKEQSDE